MASMPTSEHRYYRLALFLSTVSVLFGVLREFIIIEKLGFTSVNDELQIYLSIFYSISLALDAIRLAGLNLCEKLPVNKLLHAAVIVYLPFTVFIALLMSVFVGKFEWELLSITMIGSFMNLMLGLLITLKQRFGGFFGGQLINLLPNFILIPGVLLVFAIKPNDLVFYLLSLCVLIPFVQLLLLPLVKVEIPSVESQMTTRDTLIIFLRHLLSTLGEQLFQLVTRAGCLKLGSGYLSVLAMTVRVYAAVRFILIDTYIGSKLSQWKLELATVYQQKKSKLFNSGIQAVVLVSSLLPVFRGTTSLLKFSVNIGSIFLLSFYFMACVRIIYFRINRFYHDSNIIIKFGLYEIFFSLTCYVLLNQAYLSLIFIFWLWYIIKPFLQIKLLEPKFSKLVVVR